MVTSGLLCHTHQVAFYAIHYTIPSQQYNLTSCRG